MEKAKSLFFSWPGVGEHGQLISCILRSLWTTKCSALLRRYSSLDSYPALREREKQRLLSFILVVELHCSVWLIKSYLSSFDFSYLWLLQKDIFVRFKRAEVELFDDLCFMHNIYALRFFFSFKTTKGDGSFTSWLIKWVTGRACVYHMVCSAY